jgi:hypothetical protein
MYNLLLDLLLSKMAKYLVWYHISQFFFTTLLICLIALGCRFDYTSILFCKKETFKLHSSNLLYHEFTFDLSKLHSRSETYPEISLGSLNSQIVHLSP